VEAVEEDEPQRAASHLDRRMVGVSHRTGVFGTQASVEVLEQEASEPVVVEGKTAVVEEAQFGSDM
jgi:hypothetical protein